MAALGAALAPEDRSGLMLFLRRGMWAWARTWTTASSRESSVLAPAISPVEINERRTVIHVFAALTMKTHERRAA